MAELSTGVRTLLARMESNPEEFYGEADKWRFMFSPNFREVMTEPEKGALHEALAEVRRKEFDERVMRRLLQDDLDEQTRDARSRYDAQMNSVVAVGSSSSSTLKIGNQTLSEQDLASIKEANTARRNNSFI